MRVDHSKFWREYRAAFYPSGGLTQRTVDALEFVLNRIERDGLELYGTVEAIAYCLGTWRHESGQNVRGYGRVEFEPVREKRANSRTQAALYRNQTRYFKTGHQGRGLVQTTWEENYRKVGNLPQVKGLVIQGRTIDGAILAANPDLMLDRELSYLAAREGMRLGIYRPPHKLSMYFKPGKPPLYVQARDIVNGGRDQAELIAGYARAFERILRASIISLDQAPEVVLDAIGERPLVPSVEEIEADAAPESDARLEGGAFPTPGMPYGEEEGTQATGTTSIQTPPPPTPPIPSTEVKPTSFNGRSTSITGFISATAVALLGKFLALPLPVLVALILSIGMVITTTIIMLIRLKDKREQRAHEKDIALIEASKK